MTHIRSRFQPFATLTLAAMLLLTISCKRKEAAPPPNPTPVLQPGTGAVLVVFPDSSPAEDWMAQVHLFADDVDTRTLPRTPLGDLHALVVLNVPPGTYQVTARSWNRRDTSVPKSGGSRTSAVVTAGHVLILRARQLDPAGDRTLDSSLMTLIGSKPWQLSDANLFHGYISGIIQETARG